MVPPMPTTPLSPPDDRTYPSRPWVGVGVVSVVDAIVRDADGLVEYHYTLIEVAADAVEDGPAVPVAADDALEVRWATPGDVAVLVPRRDTRDVIARAVALRGR
jgi:8-oxo-dGTP diphosphatase